MPSSAPMAATPRLTRTQQRQQTRTRLLDAAAELFAVQGIGATSVEHISEHAGFSRGAFYSNFTDRDAIVFALLERRGNDSWDEVQEIRQASATPDEFLLGLFNREGAQSQHAAALFMEFVLYTSRHDSGRSRLRSLYRRVVDNTSAMIEEQFATIGLDVPIEPRLAAKIMLALDEGIALMRLIDADEYPRGMWSETIQFLNDAAIALVEKRMGERSAQ